MTKRKKPAPDQTAVPPPARAVPVGRVTTDVEGRLFGGRLSAILPPPSADGTWRSLNLDARTLDRITPLKLAEYLCDVSPDVSRALFDFLRECNAGWELRALVPGTEDIDDAAQAACDELMALLRRLYGSPDVVFNRLFVGIWMRGAAFAELVLDPRGRAVVDLVTPDPSIVRFRRIEDPVRGQVYQLGQMQAGEWVSFDRETIAYLPVDPLPGVPYGRPLIAPALFVTLFLIGLLHDLRRVISQQGYPRYDIEIVLEELAKQMPSEMAGNAAAQQQWVNAIVDQVASYYASLEPDSAFVHTSTIKLNRPVGTTDTESLGGVGAIIEALERMAVRALKTVPFMMALTESTTESQSNRQFEQHAISIRSMQHLVESCVERLVGVGLQARGIVAEVRHRFAENRASEEMRDEQVRQLRIANAREAYAAGYFSQDDASQYAVGQDADEDEPRDGGEPAPPDPASQENPDPSANRAVRSIRRTGRAKLIPLGADDGFDPISAVEPMDEVAREALADLWDVSMVGANRRYRGMLRAALTDEDGEEADGG